MTYLTALEIAEAGVRLKLKAMPHSKRGVQDFIDREGWAASPLCRKRTKVGGGMEYHISLLPEVLQAALHGERNRELVLVSQQAKKTQEIARREKLSTANLSARQRDVMNARSAVLSAIDMHQISNGMSQRQAIQSFLADPAAVEISETILRVANDRANKASVSRATLYDWFKLRDTVGVGALAPLPTKEKQDVPSWFWQFLRFYAQPQKPCLTDALAQFKKALPAHIMPPNYDQVRRLMARLGNVEKHRGREGSLTLKSRMAYTLRSTDDLLPGCVYTADGKTFDAEIAHPIHGQPFRPEITSIVDVATRRCVGFSFGLAENTIGVVDALRYACEQNGIPAIFYVDRGPGFKNDVLDNQLTGVTERLGITKLHSLPQNSQARGIIERFNGSVWNPLSKEFATYIGEDMDRQARQRSFKATRKDIKLFGSSSRLPSWQEFLTACVNAVTSYNAKPHSSLPGKMSPDQYWEYHVSTGFEIVPVLEHEKNDLFRPYVKRKVSRSMVEWLTNTYFNLALEEFHGEYVLVGYDIHDASKVWVREIDRKSGEELMGRLICLAIFAGNEERYIPLTMERAAIEKRANARARRLKDHLAEVEAELSPGSFIDASIQTFMPIIDHEPAPVPTGPVLVTSDGETVPAATGVAEVTRIQTFATDEALAAWALENPEKITARQADVLRRCLQQQVARELFRMSGIDVEALRNVLRAVA
ncbi:Mu transposase C-terminal domain-containing protein [Rhizobium pusense]|uniref:Mu transposase C-terminal domain-containing protein n=1 Tax=Agrobacterium pusense TaxID=648995 RepID=UPI00244B007D|nr:Mu transposase C-terminal domain-containing protein [Agrobacterium pusense]MDH1094695.1 Mu transposase C-terminal domain-containing protein [Agrobacterium pusense]MDH1111380.1 Mu transposase C-terminal domain-containing protein [Agrobacterium pusense]MDH2192675.1 Mu transposase C-terminal domain-containing protein [Agrobacterium pusense]